MTMESPLALKRETATIKHASEEAPADPEDWDGSEQELLTWDPRTDFKYMTAPAVLRHSFSESTGKRAFCRGKRNLLNSQKGM